MPNLELFSGNCFRRSFCSFGLFRCLFWCRALPVPDVMDFVFCILNFVFFGVMGIGFVLYIRIGFCMLRGGLVLYVTHIAQFFFFYIIKKM